MPEKPRILVAPEALEPEEMEVLREFGTVEVVDEIPYCSKCGFFDCVCQIREQHAPDCRFRIAMECPVGVNCDHGYDVCPECDACTCE
jgi:hypothetical protein